MKRVQYTVRNVPAEIDKALRLKAHKSHESLNEVLLTALRNSIRADSGLLRQHDLDFISGSWVTDAQTDEAPENQRRVDGGL